MSAIALVGCAHEPEATTGMFDAEFRAEFEAILADYKVESVSAIDLPAYYVWRQEGALPGALPIHGSTALTDQDSAKLAGQLSDYARPHDGVLAMCFDPRHAVTLRKEDSIFTIAICFECDNAALFGDFPEGNWSEQLKGFSDDLKPYLDSHLKAAGIPITPSG